MMQLVARNPREQFIFGVPDRAPDLQERGATALPALALVPSTAISINFGGFGF